MTEDEELSAPGFVRWFSDHGITVLSIIFAAGCLYMTVNSLSTRVDRLERRDEAKDQVLSDLRADIKVLLERTELQKK